MSDRASILTCILFPIIALMAIGSIQYCQKQYRLEKGKKAYEMRQQKEDRISLYKRKIDDELLKFKKGEKTYEEVTSALNVIHSTHVDDVSKR